MPSNQISHQRNLSRRQVLLTAAAITGGAAMSVAIPGRHALGAVDGRTVNPMKLRLGQWLNFGKKRSRHISARLLCRLVSRS